eukprot:COSAG01_NODE_4575_length_4911_cov_4.356608_1_plen_164_part_10
MRLLPLLLLPRGKPASGYLQTRLEMPHLALSRQWDCSRQPAAAHLLHPLMPLLLLLLPPAALVAAAAVAAAGPPPGQKHCWCCCRRMAAAAAAVRPIHVIAGGTVVATAKPSSRGGGREARPAQTQQGTSVASAEDRSPSECMVERARRLPVWRWSPRRPRPSR